MKAPAGWLSEYLKKPLPSKIMAESLEAGGIEVEQILYTPKLSDQIIVAEIKKIAQHPNADKLKLATISNGGSQITLVCGAPNLKIGQKVAYAPVGADLPDGTKIASAQIRGVESAGMLCSPKELGLNDDHSGLLVIDPSAKLGQPIEEVIGRDDVIEVTTQANRFDLLSLVGLAREISAQTGNQLEEPGLAVVSQNDLEPAPAVEVESKSAVRRYMLMGTKLANNHTAAWAKARLEAAEQRSINLAVDITNYTMLEFGQPLHAFDAAKVKLPIVVRMAKANEALVTLDGVKRRLDERDLVIADQTGPIALAGVMGGASTEVGADTTEILLEAASFDGATIRKTALRHGLRSEASARFERNLPPQLAEVGLRRALFSFKTAASGVQTTAVADIVTELPEATTIAVDPDHIAKILSLTITAKDLQQQLTKFGFEVKIASEVTVKVPWWRTDVKLAEDLAEEYIRLVGYDQVPARLPKWQATGIESDHYWPKLWETKAILKSLNLFEVITYSFVSKDQLEDFGYKLGAHLKLKNPLSQEQAYLRQNLLPSLLTVAIRNQTYLAEYGVYEISQVFIPTKPGQQPHEPKLLGVLVRSRQDAYALVKAALDRLEQTFNAELTLEKSDQLEFLPGHSALILAAGQTIGRIGLLHPKHLSQFKTKTQLAYLELNIESLWDAARPKRYQPISRFPSLYRDLAVIVDRTVLWQDLAKAVVASKLARPSFLNDYYDASLGEAKKSLAFRLEMTSLSGTLTDKEADQRMAKIIALLSKRFGAAPRS